MHSRICSSRLVLLASLLLAQLLLPCHGHGFMVTPLSRARVLGYGEYESSAGNGLGAQPYRKNPDGTLLNDQADVCGDPHQDTGDMSLRSRPTGIQATYTAGSTISVTFRARVNHGGWIGFKLCTTTRTNPGQTCFDQYPLVNADTGYTRWWIQTGSYGTQTDYVTRWRLPAGVSCDGGCVLQMTYRTANSCVDSCSAAECGPAYSVRNNLITGQYNLPACGRTEVFRDCADVRITPNGGTSSPPPPPPSSVARPPPPPTTATRPPPPPTGTCTSPTAATFCQGKATGFYGDKCASCTWYYWCYGTGSAYMQCGAGTAMDSRGTAQGCDYPASIVC